jgi:hypothetical protein
MFGMGSINEQTFSGAQALVDVIGLIAEPDRKRLTEQLREMAEMMKRIDAARAALTQHEHSILNREHACEAAEKALTAREEAVLDKELQAQALLHRAEDAKAALDALRADLKSKMAA